MSDIDYNFFYEPPEDPLREEAQLHAEAELEWVAEEAERGDGITWEHYGELFNEATEAQYQRLVAEAKADFEARKCECGGYFEYAGIWQCDRCGKTHGEPFDLDIPF
jgi:ribosomal protein L37AE/L43A